MNLQNGIIVISLVVNVILASEIYFLTHSLVSRVDDLGTMVGELLDSGDADNDS